MVSKMQNKFLNHKALQSFMESNSKKWDRILQFKSSFDEFVVNLNKIESLTDTAFKDVSEIDEQMEEHRLNIGRILLPLTHVLELYGIDHNKKKLVKRVLKTKDKTSKASLSTLNKQLTKLTSYVEEELTKTTQEDQEKTLEGYGLSTEWVNNVRHDTHVIHKSWMELKYQKKEIKEAKKEIKKLNRENDTIIKERFDVFMSIFKFSDIPFFKEYKAILKPLKSPKSNEEDVDNQNSEAKTEDKDTSDENNQSTSTRKPRKTVKNADSDPK